MNQGPTPDSTKMPPGQYQAAIAYKRMTIQAAMDTARHDLSKPKPH